MDGIINQVISTTGHAERYCSDPSHWCHTDVGYHELVTRFGKVKASEEEMQRASSFFLQEEESSPTIHACPQVHVRSFLCVSSF